MRNPDPQFWKSKKVLLTGHTGFKGAWLKIWLELFGAQVCGYSLAPPSQPNLHDLVSKKDSSSGKSLNVQNLEDLRSCFSDFSPEIVFHLAAQSLVRASYSDPIETFLTNAQGTLNLLEAARGNSSVKSLVVVTTDKVYENQEWPWPYRENEKLGGHDPYSASKACAEIITRSMTRSFFNTQKVGVATARAGNVFGGGDWASDRLIPDLLRGLETQKPVTLRNPKSIRPWQHVLEPLSGYLILAESVFKNPQTFSEAWNFGPRDKDAVSVGEMSRLFLENFLVAQEKILKIDTSPQPHEAGILKLDFSKAQQLLSWEPRWSLKKALALTAQWYDGVYLKKTKDPLSLCQEQIRHYEDSSGSENA